MKPTSRPAAGTWRAPVDAESDEHRALMAALAKGRALRAALPCPDGEFGDFVLFAGEEDWDRFDRLAAQQPAPLRVYVVYALLFWIVRTCRTRAGFLCAKDRLDFFVTGPMLRLIAFQVMIAHMCATLKRPYVCGIELHQALQFYVRESARLGRYLGRCATPGSALDIHQQSGFQASLFLAARQP